MPVQTIGDAEQLNAQALADVTSSRTLPSIFQKLTHSLPLTRPLSLPIYVARLQSAPLTQALPALSGLPVYVASSQFGSSPFHFPAFLI